MSLYNALVGYNPACIVVLPMLGRTADDYPRFRNCFISKDEKHIEIYTRVGGNNRGQGYGEEELYKDPNFVDTYDDDFDNTYATYVFTPPERWKEDFDRIVKSKFSEVSDEYVAEVKKYYPTLSEKIDILFGRKEVE